MTTTKHTPGPWEVKHRKIGNTPTICAADGPVLTHDRPAEEFEANATLGAAAPEMLAALKLVEDCDAFIPPIGHENEDDREQRLERIDMVLRAVRAAIAKGGMNDAVAPDDRRRASAEPERFDPHPVARDIAQVLFTWSLEGRTFTRDDVTALQVWQRITVEAHYADAEIICRQSLREHGDFVTRHGVG